MERNQILSDSCQFENCNRNRHLQEGSTSARISIFVETLLFSHRNNFNLGQTNSHFLATDILIFIADDTPPGFYASVFLVHCFVVLMFFTYLQNICGNVFKTQ